MTLPPNEEPEYAGEWFGLENGNRTLAEAIQALADLFGTEAAAFGENGACAQVCCGGGWCRAMDSASRRLSGAVDFQQAAASGKWLCHESRLAAAKQAMQKGEIQDITCNGGIRIYSAPIVVQGKTAGAVIIGYGTPPRDRVLLGELAESYGLSFGELDELSKSHELTSVAPETAKLQLLATAKLIGAIIQLRKSESIYRRLLEAAPDAMIVVDPQGHIVIANTQTERLFGYALEELRGQPIEILIPERSKDAHQGHRGVYSRSPQTRPMGIGVNLKGLRKDGSEFPADISLGPLETEDGMLVTAAVRDISAIRKTEDDLRTKTFQIQAVAETLTTFLSNGNWREATATILKEALRQSRSTLGFAGSVVEGPALRILAHEGIVWDQKADNTLYKSAEERLRQTGYLEFRNFDNLFGAVITTGQFVLTNDCRNDARSKGLPSGHPFLQNFLAVPVLESKQVIGMIAVANSPEGYTGADREKLDFLAHTVGVLFNHYRHLEQQTVLQEQLRQAQKIESIGRLAGGIAHDFNNLLTVILGHSSLLADRLPPDSSARLDVEQIAKAGERAASLTRQLLAFSRKQLLQPVVLDINTVVSHLGVMLKRLIGEHIHLTTSLDAGLKAVKADPSQIEQVIVNLAVNARDAMPLGGKLIIETRNVELDEEYARAHSSVLPGLHVMLAVSDNGCGMTRETLSQIFEPFFTTKAQGKGTGLGLAMVYGIVKQSGGSIWAYSEVGHGTTFKVYLPTVKEESERQAPPAPPSSQKGTETILLVEDDEMVRELSRDFLEQHGYVVLEAHNPQEALRIARQPGQPIHLLLTDVVMPEMSGRHLAEQLKEIRPDLKVVYMSGYTDNAIHHHGVLDPGLDFIAKPFTGPLLTQKIRQVLS